MELQRLTLIACLILLVLSCKGKKNNYVYELAFPEVNGAAESSEVPLSVDDYARVFLEPEGKSVLYIVARETREGWGLGVAGFKSSRVAVPPARPARSTFYVRYGDAPFALPCGMAAVAVFVLALVREKRKTSRFVEPKGIAHDG